MMGNNVPDYSCPFAVILCLFVVALCLFVIVLHLFVVIWLTFQKEMLTLKVPQTKAQALGLPKALGP